MTDGCGWTSRARRRWPTAADFPHGVGGLPAQRQQRSVVAKVRYFFLFQIELIFGDPRSPSSFFFLAHLDLLLGLALIPLLDFLGTLGVDLGVDL